MLPQLPSVLIVDGNPSICEVLFDKFENNGFVVNATQDPMTALHLARTGDYDMAIVDGHLPGVDGFLLFIQMRGGHPQMRGILVTDGERHDTHPLVREAGFHEVVQKSVEFSDLMRIVLEASS